jgi:tetratricopeptide (TPR) repeat protein
LSRRLRRIQGVVSAFLSPVSPSAASLARPAAGVEEALMLHYLTAAARVFTYPARLPYLKRAARGFTYPARAARRRPWLALALVACILGAVALAGNWYLWYQWEAAQQALAEGRSGEARSRLAFCLFFWPRDAEVHRLAARAARLSGDVRAAEDHLKRSLKLGRGATQPVQLEFLLLRVQTGELEEVAPTLIDSVEKGHPEAPVILETLAGAYLHRLRYKPAHACLTRWIEIRPDEAKPHLWRGWVLERLNRHKAAAEDYRRALALNPDLFTARLRLAELLLQDKRVPDAVTHLERLYRQAPENPQVQAGLGICRFYQNQAKDARRLMEAAVVHLPKDAALLIHLGRLDIQEGCASEAEQHLRQVLRTDPADTEALYNLASALQLQNRTSEAAAAMKEFDRCKALAERTNKLLREVVDSPNAGAADYAEVGGLLLQIGRDRLGVYWLDQALERDPGNLAAHRALADHYAKAGDRERAESHRRQLRESVAQRDNGTKGQESKETKKAGQ